MAISIREITPADAAETGRIMHDAFAAISSQHRFPPDFPSVEAATDIASMLIDHPKFFGVVAEEEGKVLGSNFIDFRSEIGGIGPISIDPERQNTGVGGKLMVALINESFSQKQAGTRLVQLAYHNRSLCLYSKLGFRTRAPLSIMQGTPLHTQFEGYCVRKMSQSDTRACETLCRRVHGMSRSVEIVEAATHGGGMVVEHLGAITGYTTGIGFFTHSVGATNIELMALISAAPEFSGPGFFIPTCNHELFCWCLSKGLRLVAQATLMAIGLYSEPDGAWLPSVLY